MPVTGVFNQNQTPLENSDSQFDSTEPLPTIPPLPPSSDNCTPENAMSAASTDLVSSTTADLVTTVMEEPSEQPVSVESTVTEIPTSVESAVNTQVQAETSILSDRTQDTSDTHTSNPIEHEDIPSTSFHQTSNTSFQSAFAAFASATTIQTEAEAMEVEDSCATPNSEVVSNISHDESSPLIEQSVTSTIDSGVVTTTQESLTLSTVSLEPPKNSHVAVEQVDLDPASAIETTGDCAVAPSFAEAQTIENPSVDAQHAIVEAPSSIEVLNTEIPSTIEAPLERSEQHPSTASEAQPEIDSSQQVEATEVAQSETNTTRSHPEEVVSSDAVYFIQMADSSGEIVTSIIDPNDITSYSESIVYKQCMGADGQIETTIVNSGGVPVTQTEQQAMEEPLNVQPEVEQQVIYAQDLNGHLTPIDSAQSATDVAPPGKQFVYMQDSSGRIIRTIMDANQTMVPGQQVYYTQSDDGRIITSVMDSTGTEEPPSSEEAIPQQHQESQPHSIAGESGQLLTQATAEAVTATSAFAMDNSMSGLNMLAELSHLTAGQASVELKGPSSTDSNSRDTDMEEFRPVAMITRRVAEDGVEVVKSGLSSLKFAQDPHGIVPQESMVTRLVSEIKTQSSGPGETVSHDNLFVQWQNLDAMCWMDVVLVMLVYSPTLRPLVNLDSSHELACTLLIKLLKANRQAQILLQNLLKRSSEANLQTGAGNIAVLPDAKSSKLVCKENMDEIGKAINILYAMREKIWQALQPRLRCERGKHNSPVLVLPLLVREKPIIKQMFTMNYRYVFKCAKCGYSQDDGHSKILPTIPAVPLDFNMKEPCFVRNCFECQAPDQRMRMKFEGLQDFVQMHFVKGLPHNRFNELSFDHNGDHYEVTGIVHYKNNPDHFIAWVRNAPGNTWMECDDLKSVITRYQTTAPAIPPSQVHMVMWERRLSPEHTLVMRDSDDTKYLASLVLTVQQPASSQATSDTSNANQKRLGTPVGSSGNAASLSQAGPATTFLSGLISQSQSSGSLPSRGRGSRGRGTRTPRGAMTIRRASPSVTTQMTTPRQAPTQIIRLPVSALQNSNLRGSIGTSSPRYVFVGGNNGQSTQASSANTANKVVVLRSPGGSSSLSAAQLLQLLQRSGAISQSNTRITTQITRPAGEGTADTQTFIATNAPTQTEEAVPMTTTTAVITQSQVEEDNKNISLTESQPNTVESMTSAISTDISATTESLSAAPCESAPATESQEAETIPVMATNSSANESSSGIQENPGTSLAASGTIRTLSMTPGEPARYIQIPNTSGGPNIVTQLVMKGGKMILVPVDKNSQTQVSSTPSIIRLPGSAIKSSQLNTSTISSPTILQTNTSLLGSTSSTSTVTSPQYITLPGSQVSGNKRTIQLISVPRGANSTGAQTASKTIIVSPASSQTSPRIIADPEASVSGRETMSQTGNILIREVKRPEDSSSSIINTIPALQSVVEGSTNTVSSSTVSLLRDMNLKSVGKPVSEEPSPVSGISLLSGSQVTLSKPQESFKYILPGSSLHQMSAIQNVSGPQSGRAFTALSSSGTIIGGHLTPTSGVISVDQGTSVETVGDGTQTIYTTIKEDDTPIVRGRGRGRGQRGGRGRGVRARGRGRQQLTDTVSISTHPQSKVVKRGGTISMLSADLRQVGGQIIESSTEDVDGVPVVSIPDFSGVGAMQTESVSAAESLRETISQTDADMSETVSVSKQEDIATSVITQAIPAIKGNHGFDILTQGILGTGGQPASTSPRKSGISLLTGKTVVPSSSFSSTISLEASKTQQSLAMGQSVTQNEIETLIKAAQGAAKPPKPGDTSVISSMLNSYTNSNLESLPSTNPSQAMGFSPDRFIGAEISSDIDQVLTGGIRKENEGENLSNTLQSSSAEVQEHPKQMEEERIVSVDESQVSAAERYRMPTELFQPDDESPEKPVKSDLLSRQLSGSQILGEDLPSKLFQDSEISSQEDDLSLSPQRQPKSPPKGSPQGPVNKSNEEYDDTTTDIDPAQLDESLVTSRAEADMEVDTEIGDAESETLLPDVKSPGKRGRRSKGKGKAKGRGGRKKSVSLSDTHESPLDVSPPRSMSQTKSPENGQQLSEVELPEDEKGSLDIQASPKHETTSQISPIRRSKDSDFKSEDGEVQKSESKDSETDQLVTQFEPAVVRTKAKVSWGQDESQLCSFPFMFNYQILTRKHKKNGHRHKSLGPQETCFTSPPEPLPSPIRNNKDIAHMPLHAVVNRHRMKALERPTVDPSKEPTVIPLVAEEDGDPACTGGSVVTSHIDGEVFTGVIVRQRREIADWSCGLEEDEEEEFNDGDLMEDKDVAREYAETMWTAMCMEIGDFSVFDVSDSEYDCDFEEEGVISDDSFDQGCESSGQNLEALPKIENVDDKIENKPQDVSHQSLPENSKSPKRKRSISDDIIVASPLDAHSPKRPKIDHSMSPLKEETEVSITSDISTKVDMNGISSNQVSSSNTDQDLPSAMLSSAPSSIKQESFASPARRSSRTPIPSFKIRDLDEKPLKNTTKGRRSSVLSSDDDHSGYNSDEVSLKKGKKKPAKTMLVESAPL